MANKLLKPEEVGKLDVPEEGKVKRQPVNYRLDALNWDFILTMAEIAAYADAKYGSCEQYTNARLDGDKSPVNHIVRHLKDYVAGVKHDKFGTRLHNLSAIAYNAMMEAFYLTHYGRPVSPVNLQTPEGAEAEGLEKIQITSEGAKTYITLRRRNPFNIALDFPKIDLTGILEKIELAKKTAKKSKPRRKR